MKRLVLALILSLGASLAYAQSPTTPTPFPTTIVVSNATIGSDTAFKNVFDASTGQVGRVDCLIQNKAASNAMYLYFGAPADGVSTNSLTLAAGETFRCNNGGVVIRNQISIGGISTDRYLFGQ